MTTFTLPAPLEFEINQLAEAEHKPVSTWIAEKLAKVIEDYGQRATQDEETLFLRGVEASLAEEWLDEEDEENYRDL
jgi:hypothetical protein